MTCRQENPSSGFPLADDMAGGWCAEDTILSHKDLLHAISTTDLGDQLNDLGIPVTPISTNHKEATLNTFGDGEKNAGDKRLAVMGLLKDLDFLPKT